MNTEISLKDENYFELSIGSRILKKDIFNSSGTIAVYSANVFEPFGNVKLSNIEDFTKNYVLWGIDGNFALNIKHEGEIFATTDHCGTIKILNPDIIPEYILFELELQKHILGFDRTLRPSLTNMKKVAFKIPITEDGNFDVDSQQKIVEKYLMLKEMKNNISNEIKEVSDATLGINIKSEAVLTLTVSEIFDLTQSTNNSTFTKSFVNKNKGDIPVYSASKNPESIEYGYVQDNLPNVKYFENILTWNIDGSVGKALFREGRFTLSEKVIPMILKDEWVEIIDYLFVKYMLEKMSVEHGFGFSNKAGKTRIKNIEIQIPAIRKDGELIPDIEGQKKLADEYRKLHEIKESIVQHLQELIEIYVEI